MEKGLGTPPNADLLVEAIIKTNRTPFFLEWLECLSESGMPHKRLLQGVEL